MSLSKYTSTPETTNTARLARLILGPCTDVLRDILKNEIPPSDLSKEVKQWTDDKKNRKRKPLIPSQNDIIFPSPTNQYRGDYSDLDISILYVILRNVSKIPPHSKGWGENPDPADRGVAANIERIRLLRNKYYGHSADISLSGSEFSQEWRNIWNIVVELERHLGTSTMYQESVKEVKTCSMDPEREHRYINRLGAVDELHSYVSKVSGILSDVKKKLSLRKDPKLEKEIETTMVMVNNHHKEMEKVLVKTRAFDRVKELLEKNRHVMIKGVPGSGKTTLAKYLLKIFMDAGKSPLQVFKMSKLYGRVSPNDNLAIFIDNAFGESSFSINDFNDFLNKQKVIESLVKTYNSVMGNILIFTVRNDIYMEIAAKQKSADLLFSSVTDLSVGEYSLESEEFTMFLNNYNLPRNIKENLKLRKSELYFPLGFPQCCRLAHENLAFENNLSNFLISPSLFLKDYLKTLIAERAVKTAVLIYILLKGGKVEFSFFSGMKDRKLKSIALQMLDLSPEMLCKFHDSVKVFEGFLIIYDEISNSYSFSHSSVKDILFHILIVTIPDDTILNCHSTLLQRLTTSEHLKYTNILVDTELFSIVSKRIIQILRDGFPEEYESISLLELWNDKGFYDYILKDQVCSNLFKESVDSDGNTLLVHFGKSGNIGWVEYLLQNNCDQKQKYRSLNAASRENNVNIVNIMLSVDTKFDLNTCFYAVQSGNLDLLLKLCKSVDLNQTCLSLLKTDTTHSLIQEIFSSGQIHLGQPLLEKYPILVDIRSSHGESVLHYASELGEFDIISYLVANYPQLFDVENKYGYTALHYACVSGDKRLISFLIEKGLNNNAKTLDGENVLHIASIHGKYDACVFFVTNYPQLIEHKDNDGYTVLHSACVSGERKLIYFLIEKGLDINARTNDGESVLHIACRSGKYDASEFLVTYYPQLILLKDNKGYTVLHSACVSGDRKLILFLIEKGLDINALTTNGANVLQIACFSGKYDASEFLVTNYPQLIDVQDNKGYTILHSACASGDRKLISLMLRKGLDVNAVTHIGRTVLHIACLNGRYDACEFLVNRYPHVIHIKDNNEYTALHSACVSGDVKLISFLISKGLDTASVTNKGESALHIACLNCNFNACEFLVTSYTHLIDIKNNGGYTALHYACLSGDRHLISFLIGMNFDVNALTKDKQSVLHIASRHGKYDACEFLVTKYPKLIDIKDNDGNTVLHSACVSGDRKLISFLIEKGLDINALTKNEANVLHIACCNGNYDACEFFVTNYPQLIDLKSNKGYTVLHSACVSGDRKLILFLIEKGLDINALTINGANILHIACLCGKYDASKILVTNYPQLIDVKDNNGYTVLHSACVNGDRKLISSLIKIGLNVNALTNDGKNVLHVACLCGKYDACELFVTYYPQLIDVKDNAMYTVLHAASVGGDWKMISFLIEKGLDIDAVTNNGECALHIACRSGNYDTSEFLVINYPQLIHVKDNDGYTVLHAACIRGDRKLISFLIGKGLDINAPTIYGANVLHIACFSGKYDACEFLVTNYPQLIDVQDNKGYTVIHSACANGDRKLISLMLRKGLDVNAVTHIGRTVLNIACLNGRYDACEFLVNSYPHVIHIKDNNEYTALHSACVSGDVKLISFLISKGLDTASVTNKGESALHIACLNCNFDACEFLVTSYPHLIDIKDNDGYSALHYACISGDRHLISLLIGMNFDVNVLTKDKQSVLHIASRHGKYDACEFLVTKYPKLIDIKDNDGYTSLHSACVYGDTKLISFLIEKGLKVNGLTVGGKSVLHIACLCGKYNASEFLVTNHPQLIYVIDNKGNTVLHSACVNGDRKLISFLIRIGLDVNELTSDGKSILYIACFNGKYNACEFFVSNYPELIDVKDNKGGTVLHAACVNGDKKLISFLIEKGLDINALTNDGETVLHIACFSGKYDACEFLVTHFPQLIDFKDNKGYTVLHSACVYGGRKLIYFLIGKGLDINALTNNGESTFHIACRNGNYDASEFLVTNYPQLIDVQDNKGYTVLHSACANGDRKLISLLLRTGVNINAVTHIGRTVLHIACLNGKYDACEFLVNRYSHVIHIKDNNEYTALHSACVSGDVKLISSLISKGLDTASLTNKGESALHIACLNCNFDACEFLVTSYPHLIDIKDNDGYSALHYACISGDRHLISLLIGMNFDMNVLTKDKQSVLHIASRHGKYDACEFLVTKYPKLIDIKDNDGNTALHTACVYGDTKLISFLIRIGLDVYALTNDGRSVLHIACRGGKYDAFEFFVTNYPELIDVKDKNGYTVLHAACVSGDRKLVSFLIEKGLDINALTNEGATVLHIACYFGNTDLCKFIAYKNPQILWAKDFSGISVLHAAALSGNLELFKYLVSKGLSVDCMTNDGRSVVYFTSKNNICLNEYLEKHYPKSFRWTRSHQDQASDKRKCLIS